MKRNSTPVPAPAARANAATSAVMSTKHSHGVGTVSVAVEVVSSPLLCAIADKCGVDPRAATGFVFGNAILERL